MELLTALENITEANKKKKKKNKMISSEEKELTYDISRSIETVLS